MIQHGEKISIISFPLSAGDWLNLAQFFVVWMGHLIAFIQYLIYPPVHSKAQTAMAIVYVLLFLAYIFPLTVIANQTKDDDGEIMSVREFNSIVYYMIVAVGMNSILSILAICGWIPQAQTMKRRSDPGSLSILGLSFQAVVFLIVGLSWLFRMPGARELWFYLPALYTSAGWAFVDNVFFAASQGIIWVIAKRSSIAALLAEETSPLLVSQ
ncbi:hypothetical protein HJFPF1_09702 [Paramyrothecium foliicola]|nr:hypothetical protein HJFPF1_09702 [Paramyrothecium foliicola]